MSLPVSITIANPDPSAAPTTLTQLIVLLRTLITAVVTGTYIPYVQGSATPAVGDQDKVWHRTDGSGRPTGTYVYYSGSWRRQYTGKQGQIAIYQGDPSVDFAGAGGLGTVGGDWDGWALCNGNNGTGDLSDRFIVGAHMSDLSVGHPSDWRSSVSGTALALGGDKDIVLTDANTFRPARPAVQITKWKADGNAPDAGSALYGSGTPNVTLLDADAGNVAPDRIPTLPPYFAVAYVKFVGYA